MQLDGIVGEDLSPGKLAIAVHLKHARVARFAHDRNLPQDQEYEEYHARGNKQLTLKAARAKCSALEADLAPWFESKNRSRACEIYIYEEKDDIKFEITHGRPYRTDGSIDIVAVCGNEPAECADRELAATDIDVLGVGPEELCEAIGKALQVRPSVAALPHLRGAYRVGAFIPEAGIKHIVYFLCRCGERDCADALDALRTHASGQTFAVLLPTERFLSDDARRQSVAAGVALVPLVDVVGLDGGSLRALGDPLAIFLSIGRPSLTAAGAAVVARALVRAAGGVAKWHDLDAAGYQRLVAAAASYDIFADELTKTVAKEQGRKPHPQRAERGEAAGGGRARGQDGRDALTHAARTSTQRRATP